MANGAPQRFMFSLAAIVAALLCCLIGLPAAADATSPHVLTIRITSVSCMPAARCNTNSHEVSTHGTLLLAGKGLTKGMTVAFPRAPGARISSSSPYSHLRTSKQGLILTVPSKAHSGHIMVLLSHGRHTSSYGPITVVRYALHPPAPPKVITPPTATAASGTAFEGQGMWIWYVSQSDGGNVASIVAQAHAADVTTVFVKSFRRVEQLLEPVLAPAGSGTARKRSESMRVAVRLWHKPRRRGEPRR